MTQPRPILKRSPHSANRSPTVAVHFPPSPVMTRTFAAYSPTSYDRSPIVVAPNACALPARGCPGRTYLPVDNDASSSSPSPATKVTKTSGRHAHPCSIPRCTKPSVSSDNGGSSVDDIPAFSSPHAHAHSHRRRSRSRSPPAPSSPPPRLPSLIPDVSSESDESDGFIAPLLSELDVSAGSPWASPKQMRPPLSIPNSQATYRSLDDFLNGPNTPSALAFLPHSPIVALPEQKPDPAPAPAPVKTRRLRAKKSRVVVCANGEEVERGSYKSLAGCSLNSCELQEKDEGCLAGF